MTRGYHQAKGLGESQLQLERTPLIGVRVYSVYKNALGIMAQLIETTPIDGLKVYGQQMVDYTVQGEAHKAYDLAMARAAFAQTTAIEIETEAYGEVLKMRQKKLEELGDCVAKLSRMITAMDADESSDTYSESGVVGSIDVQLPTIKETLEKYGISLSITDSTIELGSITMRFCSVTYGEAETEKAKTL